MTAYTPKNGHFLTAKKKILTTVHYFRNDGLRQFIRT